MAGLASRLAVVACACAAVVGVVGVRESSAAPKTASAAAMRALDEIGREAGYANWAAYQDASAAQDAAREKEAWRIIADALTYGRRVEENYGLGGNLRTFMEWVIDSNAGTYYIRNGIEIEDPGFLGIGAKTTRHTTYWQGLKPVGQVTTEIKDGIETVTEATELVPGTLDLKVGDKREVPKPSSSAAGKRPTTLDPKKDGSLGTASGGTSPLAGVMDAIVEADARERADNATQGSNTDTTTNTNQGSSSSRNTEPGSDPAGGSKPDPDGTDPDDNKPADGDKKGGHWEWSEPLRDDSLGQTFTSYVYVGDDGSTTNWGVKTESDDGTVTCKSTTNGEETECPSGMTDEPTCTYDCYRLAILAQLFECGDGTACGDAGPAIIKDTVGPQDGGDPNDPNAPQALDPGTMFANDGVTDPAYPGEDEEGFQASIAQDMFGSLRDPVHQPETDEPPPAPDPHNPGDSE